jgi:cyclopropane-fatty-acyl-phospholipid synthase
MATLASSISAPLVVTRSNAQAVLRGAPFFFRLACNVALRIRFGSLVFVLPDGRALKFSGALETDAVGVILVKDYAFARRSILRTDIGFFESYADGQWDTPSIADCLYVFARNADYLQREAFGKWPLVNWANDLRHAFNRNTRSGAKRNIVAHYDLGNSFYEKWLDRTMTYSSAVFPEPGADLASAQIYKYRRLAEAIDLKPSDSVLEIGSGWGGFAEFAAKEVGAKVTGVTISPAQFDYARARMFREGINERVELKLQDYRDVEGKFDKVASIEMFEAVGKAYWPAYFTKISEALKPGGAAGLQVITIADRFFDAYRRSTDFIQRYVFPGGMLPSPSILRDQVERAGLVWREAGAYGQHYARTLSEWHKRFLATWDDIERMGFDERFKKLWRFYLGYCEAGFRAGTTDVMQVVAARP